MFFSLTDSINMDQLHFPSFSFFFSWEGGREGRQTFFSNKKIKAPSKGVSSFDNK
jgi:hypothetical protein